MAYNGWKNYETWNVALWMFSDEVMYDIVQTVATLEGDYPAFSSIILNDYELDATPDGVAWNDPRLDIEALNGTIAEVLAIC
jgi:hypothetical protein